MNFQNYTVMSSSDIFYSPQKPQSQQRLHVPAQQDQMHFISPMIQSKNPIAQSPMFGDGVTTCDTSQQRYSTEENRNSGDQSSPSHQKRSLILLHASADSPLETPLAYCMLSQSPQNDLIKPAGGSRKSPRKGLNFEDVLIIGDDFEMECDEQLRVEEVADPACNSTLSDFEVFENNNSGSPSQPRLTAATEHDRFIPTRQTYGDYACGFETKELLFNQRLFTCAHSPNEKCDCSRSDQSSGSPPTDRPQVQASDNNRKMYQTLLSSQLLQVADPHCLESGALNDDQTEAEGGLLRADRLSTKYNALDFRAPEVEKHRQQILQQSALSPANYASNIQQNAQQQQIRYLNHNIGVEDTTGDVAQACLYAPQQLKNNSSFCHSVASNTSFCASMASTYTNSLDVPNSTGALASTAITNDENQRLPVYCGFEEDQLLSQQYVKQRVIPQQPFKVLDAPCLQDDFYLNLVDWSAQNVLAVGLGSCIYLWSAASSKVTKLSDIGPNNRVTSVQWSRDGALFGIGTHTGDLQIWDTAQGKLVRTLGGHDGRICAVAWNSSFLSTGSRDHSIMHRDLRCPQDYTAKLIGHRQEVCGLKWSFDDQQLASGGNDNKLLLWCARSSSHPLARFSQHQAAVKAIAWSPHKQGLLATGGGTQDRTIKFWNTNKLKNLKSIETGSQVCNLMFSKNTNELVSTHGYSQNQINVWKYPSMQKIASLTGHSYRVLYLAASPDGQTLVTGAGDETLRFWNVFPPKKQQSMASIVMPSFSELR